MHDLEMTVEMVSKPKNAVGDRHLATNSMHLATNLGFGRSHQMSVVACSNASSAECNISVYFFPVPSTRCAHHACINLMYTCFHSNIHALRVFLLCISWIRVAVAVAVAVTEYYCAPCGLLDNLLHNATLVYFSPNSN